MTLRRVFAVLRVGFRLGVALSAIIVLSVLVFRWLPPPMTLLMQREAAARGEIAWEWRNMAQISPDLALSVVAAEDANFCLHYGFDIDAIRAALDDGAERGASTISQQVAKNLFLWPERSWLRKGLEVGFTGLIELLWPKQRILEVYLNIAEMGPGVFGAEAAAQHHYGRTAEALGPSRAAALAVILPNPRARDPRNPTNSRARRAAQVADGAATLRADGRAACFLPN
ncbi:MAG: monofunctional biosynthetic peptidoglycan transglycosylase [Paracoccaceae bacterium]